LAIYRQLAAQKNDETLVKHMHNKVKLCDMMPKVAEVFVAKYD